MIFALCWLTGILFAANYVTNVQYWQIGVALAVGLFGLALLRGTQKLWPILFLGVVLGIVRGQVYFADQRWYDIADKIGEKVVLTGRVADEPGWNDQRLFEFYLTDLTVDGRPTPGLLKIKSQVGNVLEGQRVQVRGKVGQALGRAPAQIWYATVIVLDARQPYPTRLKYMMSRGLFASLPREQAGFVRGLLFGSRSGISQELEAALRADGLTHIIAVSGYNLTIIIAALAVFLRRKSATSLILSLAAIMLYVAMTGFSASIVRAAIMGSIVLIARYVRRDANLWSVFGVTICLMTAYAPEYLLADMSWQLSVLALAGVLLVVPRLEDMHGWRTIFKEGLMVSLAAHLATAPLIAYRFGSLSLIAPMANLVFLPVVPILMLGGVIAATLGVFMPAQAFIIMTPLRWVIDIVMQGVVWFSRIPQAQLSLEQVSLAGVLIGYACLGCMVAINLLRARKNAQKTL